MFFPNTAINATASTVPLEDLPTDRLITATSKAGAMPLAEFSGLSIGIWEITPGVSRDIEADEMFVVLSGRAVVTFDNGMQPMHLAPGSVARLASGVRTEWDVKETLRKVYILSAP
jgi:uncharacterized protein